MSATALDRLDRVSGLIGGYSTETAREYLHLLGFSHKVPNKKMVKADAHKQEAFARELAALESDRSPNGVTVYVDEGQIWQEALPRKDWFLRGQRAEVESISPGKKILSFTRR